MYATLSTARHARRLGFALVATIGLPHFLTAQEPPPLTRIRGVEVKATPLPGPSVMVGVVRDTAGHPIPGVEIVIPGISARLTTNSEGLFRFEGADKGKYRMRARKIGFAPQIREFEVGVNGGVADFMLVPVTRVLQPVVVASERPGISGVVGDSSFAPIAGASVRLMGGGMHTTTDSAGRFHLAAKGGSHMVMVSKVGYDHKLFSVSYPVDSGRRVTVWLNDVTHLLSPMEVNNLEHLRERIAWTKPKDRLGYSHEQLEKFGSEWLYDAVSAASSRFDAREAFSRDCMVVINGGPSIANLSYLTIDEVESVEIYGVPSAPIYPRGRREAAPTSIMNPARKSVGKVGTLMPASMSNTNRAGIENGPRNCPTVYVWLR